MKFLFFKKISCIVFFALFSLYISGCDTIKSWFSDEKEAVETSYNEYRNAMLSGDIEVLRNLVAREKSQELEGEDAAIKLELARSFYPADVQITGTSVTGDAATISATSPVEGGTMHGVINMIKEDGKWKLLTENWEMRFGDSEPYTEADAPTEVARPTLFHEIHGTWTGQDDRGASEWLFLFGPGFNVYIKEPSGDWHQGQALIRWDLGVESDGSIRVPPGSSVFDIDISR